jgi:hypothetical protein
VGCPIQTSELTVIRSNGLAIVISPFNIRSLKIIALL